MSAAHMVIRVEDVAGWPVSWIGDEEPRIKDLDLGERLGYPRPRKIRELIRRLENAGKLNDIHQRPAAGRYEIRPGVEVPEQGTVFYLTEAQALKVAAKSETDPADALLDEMIRVFMLARRGLLPDQKIDALPQQAEDRIATLERAVVVLVGRLRPSRSRDLLPPSTPLDAPPDDVDAQRLVHVRAFIDDRCRVDPSGRAARSDLRKAYEGWASGRGEVPMCPRHLAQSMRAAGFDGHKGVRNVRGNSEAGWWGITLLH